MKTHGNLKRFRKLKTPTSVVFSDLFDKCVVRTCRGRSIRCCLGLWGVSAPDAATAEREARHYWMQYFEDGEYQKHLSNSYSTK